MDKFREVEPLKCGKGIEAHLPCAQVMQVHGSEYLMMGRNVYDYEQARALRDFLDRALGDREGMVLRGCVWSTDDDGNYDTGCGEMFCIIEGTPEENSMKFCCYCGGNLTVEPLYAAAQDESHE